ncbi:hypothetical protein Tco_0719431 [Tanacetum coccineum]
MVACYTDAGYLTDVDDKAEYIAASNAVKEAVWIRKFIFGLGVVPTSARHYRAKVHYLREVIEFDDIVLEKVHTDDNVANPFTKALPFNKHSEHTMNIERYYWALFRINQIIVWPHPKGNLRLGTGVRVGVEAEAEAEAEVGVRLILKAEN